MCYWKYFKLLLRHKWEVFKLCCKFGIIWRGIVHDCSKFRPSEFGPHARYFCGGQCSKVELDTAWIKHISRNPHHYQHWSVFDEFGNYIHGNMPSNYRWEMWADWIARAGGVDKVKKWYTTRIVMIPDDLCAWVKARIKEGEV